MGGDQAYSELEAVPQQHTHQMSLQDKPLPTDLGKQVMPDTGKQCTGLSGEIELDDKGGFYTHHDNGHRGQNHQPWKKKWLPLIGAVALIVILAAVLGDVFGSRHKSPGKTTRTPTQRNIAALSFASGSVNNTRLYFQDNVGQVIEAASSTQSTTWAIRRPGNVGKNGSAIAAAVSRPGFPLVISVFYLDADNLIHDINYTPSTEKWSSGSLSEQGYIAMQNSSLTAMYNQCKLCANTTIIAFQDKNGFVKIGNFSSNGWSLTQLGTALDPEMGTGLALQPFYRNGSADQINLYYQKSNLNVSLASLNAGSLNNGVDRWFLNAQIYRAIPAGTPLAAASSYSSVSAGFETWIQLLYVADDGIEVNTWSGAMNDWLQQYARPSVMANSTSSKRVFEGVAVTATGNAFGVVKRNDQADAIETWQVENDMVDWNLVGNVDLGDVWE